MHLLLAAAPALRLAPPVMQINVPDLGKQFSRPGFAGAGIPTSSGRIVPTGQPPPAPGRAASSIVVQGGSLRTWSYSSPAVEQVQVVLTTEGRPLDADIELWQGPGNTPFKCRVYVENGQLAPFSAVIETPLSPNTIAIRNIGSMVFPLSATVFTDSVDVPSEHCVYSSVPIQGGALRTYPVDPSVDAVQVLLQTDGRPLNARVELLQGPNNNKQVIELYAEDGGYRPFFCVLETPGAGGVVRIVNTAPVEFPMVAAVVPHSIHQERMSYPPGGEWGDRTSDGPYSSSRQPVAATGAPYTPVRQPVAATAAAEAAEATAIAASEAAMAATQAEAAKATARAAMEAAYMAQQEAEAMANAARAEEAAAKVRELEARQRQQDEQAAAMVRQEDARQRQQSATAAREAARQAADAEKPWWDRQLDI